MFMHLLIIVYIFCILVGNIYFSYYNLHDQHLIHDCAIKNAGAGYNTFLAYYNYVIINNN